MRHDTMWMVLSLLGLIACSDGGGGEDSGAGTDADAALADGTTGDARSPDDAASDAEPPYTGEFEDNPRAGSLIYKLRTVETYCACGSELPECETVSSELSDETLACFQTAFEAHREAASAAEYCALEVRIDTLACVEAADCDAEVIYDCLLAEPNALGSCPGIEAEAADDYLDQTSGCVDL